MGVIPNLLASRGRGRRVSAAYFQCLLLLTAQGGGLGRTKSVRGARRGTIAATGARRDRECRIRRSGRAVIARGVSVSSFGQCGQRFVDVNGPGVADAYTVAICPVSSLDLRI